MEQKVEAEKALEKFRNSHRKFQIRWIISKKRHKVSKLFKKIPKFYGKFSINDIRDLKVFFFTFFFLIFKNIQIILHLKQWDGSSSHYM